MIFKKELERFPEIMAHLASFSKEVLEMDTAFVYVPQPAHLVAFVNLLHRYRLCYGVHTQEPLPEVIIHPTRQDPDFFE